jgi:two-component system CitB family response regulator
MQGGVIHYLVKPFFFDTFRERLEKYAALRTRLNRMREADQAEIDRLYGLLRAQGTTRLPKGISSPTLSLVLQVVGETDSEISATEVADRAGISRGTVPRVPRVHGIRGAVAALRRDWTAGAPLSVSADLGAATRLKPRAEARPRTSRRCPAPS